MATNSANSATLWAMRPLQADEADQLFPVTTTSRLVFNATPTKLGAGSVLAVARSLAKAELADCAISERMGQSTHMLEIEGVCKAITNPGEYQLDAVWASWVLVVYLCCHPKGRELLRGTALTDVDYQTAIAFESYGRAEVTRRARLEAQQFQSRKRKSGAAEPASSCLPHNLGREPDMMDVVQPESVMDQIAEDEQRLIATKKKRGAKGQQGASTSDSSGMLQWYAAPCRRPAPRSPLPGHVQVVHRAPL